MFRLGYRCFTGWGGGGFFMMLFWVIVILGIGYFFINFFKDNNGYRSNKRAEEIAKERYARGEIDKGELEEILRDLRK